MSRERAGLYFVTGAVCAGLIVWRAMAVPSVGTSNDEAWALPEYEFQDLRTPGIGGGDEIVTIQGTLMGDDVGWPVNTWSIHCVSTERQCQVAHVEEIGRRQLGSVNVEYWPIASWTPSAIVLQAEVGTTTNCARAKLTIDRRAKTVEYLSVPENADTQFCKQGRKLLGPERVEDWRIANPKQPWE